ncbi:Ku protein [Streptomyces sp. NBC_01306]|uniref:non-homologous end joining protein Ku n=1 Tax=Streptomyces sp. NBC_01306 TaxID=2903819 RepID=UPI0022525F9F|nr:Ku protein [Streptomyces sp. NBC_01306]MCX4723758.1 Ku protein [Streptomyces sp. NBC_01306]
MRSIWNGAISFGLVSIPIKLVNATENHSVSFRQIHTADGGRIRYRKVCELDGEELTADEIGKAYEADDGSMIPITDEDLAALPLPTAKTIDIVAFVPLDSIDPLQMGAAYYLVAGGPTAAKPYTLLREALKRSRRVAIAKFALRGRERLGMLRVVGDAIAMHGLLWPDEIRSYEGAAPETSVTVRDAELDLADTLMDTLGEVEMDSLHDDYREAVEELIAAKTSGEEAPAQPAADAGAGKVIDLMSALEKSVRAAKSTRGEEGEEGEGAAGTGDGEDAEVRELRPGGRRKADAKGGGGGAHTKAETEKPKSAQKKATSGRAAPKKAAAKRTTAKKTAAKKTTAKKSSAGGTSARSSSSKKTAAGSGASGTRGKKRASA